MNFSSAEKTMTSSGIFSDDVAEQAGVEDDTPALPDLGLQAGADAGLHVVAGQGQPVLRLQQDPSKAGDGAFLRPRCGGGIDGELQQRFSQENFSIWIILSFFRKIPAYFMQNRT